jgi:hypothetical protein
MENSMSSTLTIADARRLIGAELEPVEPPEGLRVWPGGLATMHQGGRVIGLVRDRVFYRVTDVVSIGRVTPAGHSPFSP